MVKKHDFVLIETFLFIPGSGYRYLPLHLRRLEDSSRYFNFTFCRGKLLNHLQQFQIRLPGHRLSKVRLCLHQDGRTELTTTSIYDAKAYYNYKRVIFSDYQTDAADVFYYHKTSNRSLYNQEYQHFCIEQDYYEVLFCNQQHFLTEGSRTNVFLKLPHDQYIYTPDSASGLLSGIARARLLTVLPHIKETCLTREHVYQAEKIWLSNSVRGMVRVFV